MNLSEPLPFTFIM